jgi:hypothetical protein
MAATKSEKFMAEVAQKIQSGHFVVEEINNDLLRAMAEQVISFDQYKSLLSATQDAASKGRVEEVREDKHPRMASKDAIFIRTNVHLSKGQPREIYFTKDWAAGLYKACQEDEKLRDSLEAEWTRLSEKALG